MITSFKMKQALYSAIISLLVITGIAAIFGGLTLMIDSAGGGFGFSVSRLRFLPFKNYLIPGLLLFTIIGIGSFITAAILLRKKRGAPLLLIFEGIILVSWIIIQSMSVPSYFLQFLFGTIGVVFIISGFFFARSPLQLK